MKERAILVSSRNTKLSIRKQCEVLSIQRSRIYYKPVDEKPENIKIMKLMDEHLLKYPTEGVMSMVYMLKGKGYGVNPKRIRRLLRKMGHMAIYPKRNLSRLGQTRYIRPYLLRNMDITRANQVWSMDITYIPMKKGFMYCTAIIDVFSRKIVGWAISNTLELSGCLSVLEEAIREHGKPEIINTDQGSQFTSSQWVYTLDELGVKASMDGKGRAIDNRWIERFWRTLKYKCIYLNPPEDGIELYKMTDEYIEYYNSEKTHHTTKEIPNELFNKSLQKAA